MSNEYQKQADRADSVAQSPPGSWAAPSHVNLFYKETLSRSFARDLILPCKAADQPRHYDPQFSWKAKCQASRRVATSIESEFIRKTTIFGETD
jgi:hypothetical protein